MSYRHTFPVQSNPIQSSSSPVDVSHRPHGTSIARYSAAHYHGVAGDLLDRVVPSVATDAPSKISNLPFLQYRVVRLGTWIMSPFTHPNIYSPMHTYRVGRSN
jgi:hypothetical protein